MSTSATSPSFSINADGLLIGRTVGVCLLLDLLYRITCWMTGAPYYSPAFERTMEQIGPIPFALLAVTVGPVQETLVFQAVPVALIHRVFEKSRHAALATSALLFGAAHLIYGWQYGLFGVLGGVVFCSAYLARERQPIRAIAVVSLAHAVNNLFFVLVAVHDGKLPLAAALRGPTA
ncbi:CPBP family intramembrane glutamic endopeptidase [Roseateles sp. BYS96W]|uniref:CPBP family intramembrane glutamic endopeptidase n=1 Tax=Pelomonas nitida TaxID=3299027 RepID=A0ABW7G6M5_9BURK